MREARKKVNAGLWVLSLALVLVLVASDVLPAFAQSVSRINLPVPFDVEGKQIHGAIYLKAEMETFNVPLDQFASGKLDQAESMFAKAMQAIQKQDYAKFANVWDVPNNMKRVSKNEVALKGAGTNGWLDQYRMFLDFSNVKVVAEVLLGSESVFIGEVQGQKNTGPMSVAFLVGENQQNQLKVSAVTSADIMAELVHSSFQAAQKDPAAFKPLPNVNLHYQYPIPLAGNGSMGAHPAYFVFDGTPMDFNIADAAAKAPNPVVEFERKAYLAMDSENPEAGSSFFTPKSYEVMKYMAQAQKRLPSPAHLATGYVKFVLNADPVFLVFKSAMPGSQWPPDMISYHYVVRDPSATAGYKVVNLAQAGPLESFLQNSSLFVLSDAVK